VVVLAALWCGFAHADPPTVKDLYDIGQLHFDGGQYQLAIEAWKEALSRGPRAILFVKLADAHEELAEYTVAIDYLGQYREQAEEGERASIDERIAELHERVAALEAAPDPVVPDPVVPDPVVPDPAVPDDPVVLPQRSAAPVVVEGVLVGSAVTGIAVGSVFGLRAASARSDAMAVCVEARGGWVCPEDARDALARQRTASTMADVSFAIGGVAAVAATVNGLMLTNRSGRLRLGATLDGAHVSWTIR
jgi:tetratricopeptide (TPR) repeat protein